MRHVTFSGSFCFCDAGLKKFATAFSFGEVSNASIPDNSSYIRVIVDNCCLLTGGGDTPPESLRERFTPLALFVFILTVLRRIIGEK